MALEYEKLSGEIEEMARSTHQGRQERQQAVAAALRKLRQSATDWVRIDQCLSQAMTRVDVKKYRAARPLERDEALDVAVDPAPLPGEAMLIAADGSQLAPDRHAAFLYSLVNVGVIVYFKGRSDPPLAYTQPLLNYPGGGKGDAGRFAESAAIVGLRRDRAEIEALAQAAQEFRLENQPRLAVLDQRLLYWPVVGVGELEGSQVLQAWQEAMTAIRECGCLLAGYIVKPGKQSVLTLLESLDIDEPGFDLRRLEARDRTPGLTDASLFGHLLKPGQRSKVFVDVSHHNVGFRDKDASNEVCFFYFNPGRIGRQIARIDVPISVARNPASVAAVHALLHEQCQIMGDYPYVLARADELAVVGRQDQMSLNTMIENAMQRYGLIGDQTAKQSAKEAARGGKTRHAVS